MSRMSSTRPCRTALRLSKCIEIFSTSDAHSKHTHTHPRTHTWLPTHIWLPVDTQHAPNLCLARLACLSALTQVGKKDLIMGVNWLGRKNDSSGHNVHVEAISTHYAVIWKVMELKPAWGTRLPRAPRAPGHRKRRGPESGSTCCQTTCYHGNTEGDGGMNCG